MTNRASHSVFRMEFVVLGPAALLLLLGAVAVFLGMVDETALKARIDATSPDGLAATFPLERTRLIQFRVGVYGAGLLAAGLLLLVLRRRLVALARCTASDSAALLHEWSTGIRSWIRNEPGHALALLGVVIVATVVRLSFLHQDMRYDESDSYLMFASRSLFYGLSDYPEPNNHLLNTLLMHCSVSLFGNAPWALRLPALIAGILVVPAAYWALRGCFGRWPALIAAGLSAGSSFLVHYSVNARGYSFVVLASSLGLGLCHRLLVQSNRGAAALLGLVSALGFYAVPTMLFPFGAYLVWLVAITLRPREEEQRSGRTADVFLAGTLTVALTLLLYGPVITVSGPGSLIRSKYISAMTWSHWADLLGERFAIFASEMTRTPGIALLLGIGLITWIAVNARRGGRSAMLVIALVAWCGFVVVVQRAAPYARVWTFSIPLLYGLAASGLQRIVQRLPRYRTAALVLLVVGLTGRVSWDTYRSRSPSISPEGERFEPAEDMAAYLEDSLTPEDRVLTVVPVRTPLWYYLLRAGLPAEVMSHDSGGPAFTFAVINGPLEEFNDRLREWNMPTLEESRLQRMRDFPGAIVYRIDPPLPSQ